jgi:hypothetical protein
MVETAKDIEIRRTVHRRRVFIGSAILLTSIFIIYRVTGSGADFRLWLLLIPAVLLCLKYIFNLIKRFVFWADLQIHSIRSARETRRRYKRLMSDVKKASLIGLNDETKDAAYEAKVRNFLNE